MDHLAERKAQLNEWYGSTAYGVLCDTITTELDEMRHVAITFLNSVASVPAVRQEIGSKSDLHRGYYCPSPIFDIVVGNVKRGNLLTRLTKRSSAYYVYGFDEDNRLVWVKHYCNKQLASIEHIRYFGSFVYGFTISEGKYLSAISKEAYEDDRIISYSTLLLRYPDDSYHAISFEKESYTYDEKGLCESLFQTYFPTNRQLNQRIYRFVRKNGMLNSYTSSSVITPPPYEIPPDAQVYTVFAERRA